MYFIDEEQRKISPGGKTISEVKVPSAAGAEDQAIAQIIVFSLLQKQKHPEFQHHLIPNIVISPTDFHIFMYDAVNDILLGSYPLQIFDVETESLRIESVMILWMVLHYRIFCEGIKVNKLTDDFKNIDIQSHFKKIAETKWNVYSKSLKENVGYFPPGKKRTPITFEGNWFARELTYKDTDDNT